MQVSKQLTSKSGLTIPKNVRAEAGFHPKMGVDIKVVPEGVLIKKHVPCCKFCGTVEGLTHTFDIDVCKGCFKKMKEAIEGNG